MIWTGFQAPRVKSSDQHHIFLIIYFNIIFQTTTWSFKCFRDSPQHPGINTFDLLKREKIRSLSVQDNE